MPTFDGTYLGFYRTERGLCEAALIIDGRHQIIKIVTASGDRDDVYLLRELSVLTRLKSAQIAELKPGRDISGIRAWCFGDAGIVFFRVVPHESVPQLEVIGLANQHLVIDGKEVGPTYFFTPEQVDAGFFKRALGRVELWLATNGRSSIVPRLIHHGLAAQNWPPQESAAAAS
jgi:hypothetical protein